MGGPASCFGDLRATGAFRAVEQGEHLVLLGALTRFAGRACDRLWRASSEGRLQAAHWSGQGIHDVGLAMGFVVPGVEDRLRGLP